jgi:tripartite-type tricarboxylate transporter receptor subunit TctC
MKITRRIATLAAAAAVVCAVPLATAQAYPERPVEIIVPFGPGGGADQMARMIGKLLEKELGVSFPVINSPGAVGAVGITKLQAAPADGHSLVVMTGEVVALAAQPKPKWTLKDVIPVAILMRQPSGLFVKADGPFKTWADVEAAAKAKPGALKVANNGFGSPDDIVVSFLAGKGVRMTTVPYAKPGERYSSLLGGHTDVLYEQAGDLRTFIESSQMRPVIFFGGQRMPQFQDVPASKELGLDIELDQIRMIAIRADTDPGKVKKLAAALERAAASPEFRDYNENQWAEVGFFIGGDAAVRFVRSQIELMQKYLR